MDHRFRRALTVVLEGDTLGRGVCGRVEHGGEHIVESRQRPEVELWVVVNRGLFPQPLVGRIWVALEGVVERVEVHLILVVPGSGPVKKASRKGQGALPPETQPLR